MTKANSKPTAGSAVELVERMAVATSNEEREALRAELAKLYGKALVIRTGGAR